MIKRISRQQSGDAGEKFSFWRPMRNKEQMHRNFSDGTIEKEIGLTALRALLYEVSVTPKPGLVDRNNSGAHSDMDFFSFIDSSCSLLFYFIQFAHIGIARAAESEADVFAMLQEVGLQAEKAMLTATNGVNTHRGAIFSLGLLCASIGRLEAKKCAYSEADIFDQAALFAKNSLLGLTEEASHPYRLYGLKGARGEAAEGFPHVRELALPFYRVLRENGKSINDAGAITLLNLISEVDDTNVVMRKGPSAAQKVRRYIKNQFGSRGLSRDIITRIDQRFIADNISPGGCADLLAVMFFIDMWSNSRNEEDYDR